MNALVLACYALLVTLASLRPGGGSSLDPWDKPLHFITYAIFAILAYRVFTGGRRYVVACLGIVAYGGLIELIQSWMPGRFMSGYDFLANTLGVVVAAYAMRHVNRVQA
jgi:VanZ family protein